MPSHLILILTTGAIYDLSVVVNLSVGSNGQQHMSWTQVSVYSLLLENLMDCWTT